MSAAIQFSLFGSDDEVVKAKPKKPQNVAQKFLSEVVRIGGLPMTRQTAYQWLKHQGHPAATCDFMAFGKRDVIGGQALSLTEVLQITGEAA
ncbi:MAG: hypothetical protein AAFY42_12875 [Pseudomonadota bacterium]